MRFILLSAIIVLSACNSSSSPPQPNDENLPQLSVTSTSASENAGELVFTISIDRAPTEDISVEFYTESSTDDNAATAGDDYTEISPSPNNSVQFAIGSTQSQTVSVSIADDNLDEMDEIFLLRLANASNATISNGIATGTITDDDAAPVLSLSSSSAVENTGEVVFEVTLDKPAINTVTVQFYTETVVGGATENTDFMPITLSAANTISFPAGNTNPQRISVNIINDEFEEPNENFHLRLSNAVNATIGQDLATGTIINDDAAVTLNIAATASATEGSGTLSFAVTPSGVLGSAASVQYHTVSDTAKSPNDFNEVIQGTLNFPMGSADPQFINIAVSNDNIDENDETFTVIIENAVNVDLGTSLVGTGTIIDDDDPPEVTLLPGISTMAENGGTATARIQLSALSEKTITVQYFISGEATIYADYDHLLLSVTIPPETAFSDMLFTGLDDQEVDPFEQIAIQLSGATNAILGTDRVHYIIINDDEPPPGNYNDTGLTQCFNNSAVIPCDNPDTPVNENPDFPRQDAEFGRDVGATNDADGRAGFSFTNLSANNDTCVRDNVTGLIWERKELLGSGGVHASIAVPFSDLPGIITQVNTAQYCGRSGWRLPTVNELRSIIDYSKAYFFTGPAIDENFFPNVISLEHWTSEIDNLGENILLSTLNGNVQKTIRTNTYYILVHDPD